MRAESSSRGKQVLGLFSGNCSWKFIVSVQINREANIKMELEAWRIYWTKRYEYGLKGGGSNSGQETLLAVTKF